MKLLLDTQAFIWWDGDAARLPPKVTKALQEPTNEVWFSVVNVWEMAIKEQLGKLKVRVPIEQIAAQQLANGLQVLPVTLGHVLAVRSLPPLHKNPFDRLIVAQAQVDGMQLVSADSLLAGYGTPVFW